MGNRLHGKITTGKHMRFGLNFKKTYILILLYDVVISLEGAIEDSKFVKVSCTNICIYVVWLLQTSVIYYSSVR